jgi:selT/selW/selH-like putative selenoprotein
VLKDQLGIDATLIKGSKGVFEVTRDGDLIYSKKATGEFPEQSAIVHALQG